ncbi:carbohydrate ABC transporter permease [Marisediminicola antarctica]|uniref:ABC transporter permease n=1 Tax=Marisediminicola antarctica TaxID=674079 RepID=A0A7L5AJ79_9MICO|nr:sugar ABC transporter permease [Marisediminicola antarctica]QHO70387.1 ABC transporter permease [Marisediminicola antarctica]
MSGSRALVTSAGTPAPRRRASSRRLGGRFTGLLFVAPAAALFAVFGVYTIVYGFSLSFARWNGFSPNWTWTGIQNYLDLLGANPPLATSVRVASQNTLVVMVVLPIAVSAIGLVLAVLLNSIRRFRALLRTVYFLPYVTTGIAVFYAWRFVYEPNGSLNAILSGLGLTSLVQRDGFLGNPFTSLAAVLFVLIWANVPIAMLLYLTGLQTIPESVVEAARVDGASTFRTLRSVILPLLNPITALVIIIQLREALQNFQVFLLMTNGGPVDSTQVLSLRTYQLAFDQASDLGYASALGWMLAAVAIVLAVINLRILRSRQ